MTDYDRTLICSESPLEFLELTPFKNLGLNRYDSFVGQYMKFSGMTTEEAFENL